MTKVSVNKTLMKADSHSRKKEFQKAQLLYQEVLRAFPNNKRAKQGLAKLGHAPGMPDHSPDQNTVDHLITLFDQGKLALVVEHAEQLTRQFPNAFTVWDILGAANKGLGRIDQAAEAFSQVTRLNANYPEGFNNLGVALQDQGNLDLATEAYHRAIALKPDYVIAHYNLGNALKAQGKLQEAVNAFNQALELKPDYAEADYNMGLALQDQGKPEEAIKAYHKALDLKPNYADALNNMGLVLQDQGKLKEAQDAYNNAIATKPDYAKAHRNLSLITKYETGNPQIEQVNHLLRDAEIGEDDRCRLHFTLAKMHEDTGNLEAAFNNYSLGGAMRKKLLGYNSDQDQNLFSQIKNAAQNIKDNALTPAPDALESTPIFILGMPRSGTTLVEQIISCHSQVHAGGESTLLSQIGSAIRLGGTKASKQQLTQLRNSYLAEAAKSSQGQPYITDKMPHNFEYIGLICSALPEAKIVHVKRDPAATCWSNFKNYFSTNGLGYSYDLQDVIEYYRYYKDLMTFWDQMFGDRIFHLNYDQLTMDQESESRKLLSHLELDWGNACLSPHKNNRSVRTASQQQVRQKIYQGSSQKWRKFEPFLKGAFDELYP